MREIIGEIVTPNKELSDNDVNKICDIVRECGFGLHKFLGTGFREKVYERGMLHRMRKAGLSVRVQPVVQVFDEDGTELIEETMDLIVEDVFDTRTKGRSGNIRRGRSSTTWLP